MKETGTTREKIKPKKQSKIEDRRFHKKSNIKETSQNNMFL